MAARHHAFILAGTGSGCGKTTVTLGLLRLLQKRALRVQPFKVGPDYLDTGWHTAICGVASRNLDSFMLPPPVLNALFCEQMRQADIAVIEGVMGLYDGYGVDPNYCSTAAMAKQLGCPVILLVDGKAVSTSLAATATLEQTVDVDALLSLSVLSALPAGMWPERPDNTAGAGLTLALADDEAFNFYYPDNIDLLERAGVNIVRFSPLHDRALPDCQMIWLGGGYPELYAADLAANTVMLKHLRAAHQRGVAIYAECGGLMYLGSTLEDSGGEIHQMANIIPGHSKMGKRLTRFGRYGLS